MSDFNGVPHLASRTHRALLISLVGLALLALGCGGDGGTGLPAPGGIDLDVVTSGPEPDPDGYTVTIDGGAREPIGINASRYYEKIEPGQHTVLLEGLAANCSVAGENPQTVAVAAGEEAPVEFQVTCGATSGSLRLSITTSGPAPDPDGYMVSLDGSEAGAIGVSGTVTLTALGPGAHQVGLSGLAANCSIEGENPRAVTIVAGQEAEVSFAVNCTQPPAGSGTLRVTTVTTGTDRDPNGYSLTLDGGASQPIGRAATVTLAGVSAGPHTVTLGDVAANCTVADANPRSVTVAANATTEATFVVSCATTRGTLEVVTATTGTDRDPDGYRVRVDGGTGQATGVSDTLTLPNLAAGPHSVQLVNVAANCTVAGENPRPVTIAAAATAQVSFAVTCVLKTGAIKVTTSTAGIESDPDGYLVALGKATPVAIAATGSHTFERVPPGTHQVGLTGMAANCRLEGENPRAVTVAVGDTAAVAFALTCSAIGVTRWDTIPLPTGFVPVDGGRSGSGVWASGPDDIYVVAHYGGSTQHLLLHYDGRLWTKHLDGSEWPGVMAVGGRSTNEVFAAGEFMVWQYNGAQWAELGTTDDHFESEYQALWGSAPGELYAGGTTYETPPQALLKHYDGTTWSRINGSVSYGEYGEVRDISGTSSVNVYAIGADAPYDFEEGENYYTVAVLHYDGTRWTRSFAKTFYEGEDGYGLRGVWASASNDVFVVATGGYILHYDGAEWSPMRSNTSKTLLDVWGRSSSEVYAVGGAGTLRYDGTDWTVINPTPASGIWGTATDVFVVTEAGVLHGTR